MTTSVTTRRETQSATYAAESHRVEATAPIVSQQMGFTEGGTQLHPVKTANEMEEYFTKMRSPV